nr:hypothetical protein GCM10017611_73790 [Rhodococcus wratislaviensis]
MDVGVRRGPLAPEDDETAVTATHVREVITRLREAGHHRDGDPDILLVFDAGYELARLAFVLADLPVQVLGRMRSDRVLCFPAPPPGRTGRPPRHGPEFDSPTRLRGLHPRPPRAPRRTDTAQPPLRRGNGCTRDSFIVSRRLSTRGRHRSWKAQDQAVVASCRGDTPNDTSTNCPTRWSRLNDKLRVSREWVSTWLARWAEGEAE